MAYTEKACSVCGVVNWDSLQGNHHQEHEINDKKGRRTGTFVKCDTNGTETKYDSYGHVINE
jgi:hypothetical protein